jgi:light-regulated signal transduction histidine kinase (bacteriophytochrome)
MTATPPVLSHSAPPQEGSELDYAHALPSILEDSNSEQVVLRDTQRAMLNILEDFSEEKMHLEEMKTAVLNILEDLAMEKERLQETQCEVLRSEEAIREVNASLERRISERTADLVAVNQELEAFNYSVSHDLRAPLRHIDGYSKILKDDYGSSLPDDGRRCIEHIRSGARRMGRMVDELLELSRTSRRELSTQLTGLGSLVAEVLEELKPELEDRQIEWRIGELPFADCDPALTRQIFANLLANAVKFTRQRTPAVIEVGQAMSEGQTALFVRDNGVGFSMKYADKLFGVFQRLHRREDFEGTGVGLATVQRIVHKHGGRIWAQAELDKGATFYFTLEPPARPQPEQPNPEPTPVFVGER